MTEAELLSALEHATRRAPGGEGVTVAEIVMATGANQQRVRAVIGAALRSGKVARQSKYVETISGRMSPVPSYSWLGGEGTRTRRGTPR